MLSYELPRYMIAGMVNYLVKHLEPGSFMGALLENDLATSVRRADPTNRLKLRSWLSFMERELPLDAWGSKKSVRLWLENKPKREDL